MTGDAFTTTLCVMTFVQPVVEVATKETMYVPEFAYVWLGGEAATDVLPFPIVQL